MNWQMLFKFLTLFQLLDLCQNSHVQDAKQRIRAQVRDAVGQPESHTNFDKNSPNEYRHNRDTSRYVHRLRGHHRHRWGSGHRKSFEHHHFTGWSAWSTCNDECIKRRERYCKKKRKCGFTKHVEEQKCWHCLPSTGWHQQSTHKESQQQQQQQSIHQVSPPPQSIIINAAAASSGFTPFHQFIISTQPPPTGPPLHETIEHHQINLPVLHDIVYHNNNFRDEDDENQDLLDSNFDDDNYSNENTDYDELHKYHQQSYPQNNRYYPYNYYHHKSELIDDYQDDDVGSSSFAATKPNFIESFKKHNDYNSVKDENDFYALNAPSRYKKQRTPGPKLSGVVDDVSLISQEDENDLELLQNSREEHISDQSMEFEEIRPTYSHAVKLHKQQSRHQLKRNLLRNVVDNGFGGDAFQYEDFDFDRNAVAKDSAAIDNYGYIGYDEPINQNSESYDDSDYEDSVSHKNATFLWQPKERATPDALQPRNRRLYSKWSRWTKCSPKCTTRRYKKCRIREQCGREVLREIAYCYTEGSFCQQWLQAQVQKSPPYELRPMVASRRRDTSVDGSVSGTQSNSIVSDFIMNNKGYRGPEYSPVKLKCGIPPIRNNRGNIFNMLKIIGGKAARKGDWPWQVAIFNRFKEAFCGGTLIAPQWVLTAAHCVRKVLYVRIGEHNLDYEDGTEMQLRVLKSFKHPNFDKKTVDSDVALLKLPKPVNITAYIGFSCLPLPYQPLPRNIDCTVIGWGKRRNRDAAGTSVLHQANVPIISMDNCRSVYQDYTITKNMFCAGHKRGRIDTCAGDSGGPLLCRDTTKPNHPWTIFGITSFGDGCAKRNKFGIYAKVPNYVDWVWSVINCNGNCKLHQRNYG